MFAFGAPFVWRAGDVPLVPNAVKQNCMGALAVAVAMSVGAGTPSAFVRKRSAVLVRRTVSVDQSDATLTVIGVFSVPIHRLEVTPCASNRPAAWKSAWLAVFAESSREAPIAAASAAS